jgi:hypothetical protein
MSARGLVHNDTFIFNGTNYDTWNIHMLNYFWVMDPTMKQIVDTGFSPPKDIQNLSLEDEKNLYLNAQATHVIVNALSNVVIFSIMPFWSAHDIWTKLREKYDVPRLLRMIVFLPLSIVMNFHPLHQRVARHKIMIW